MDEIAGFLSAAKSEGPTVTADASVPDRALGFAAQ
jgi:hypothetical protein